jgi:hypothetical protein
MPSGGGGGDDEEPVPPRSLGPVWRRLGPVWRREYRANAGKHGRFDRGNVGREPRNGQEALDLSVPTKPTSAVRISIDYDLSEFIVLRFELSSLAPMPNGETFHGYVCPWPKLAQEMKNALIRHGMADR